ncbi:MAG: hypothetical protein IJG24_03535 [Selenomonadaceae bacterium]|nr:hypothetical protein [Selenomonadaceae bacterium]
MEIHAKILNGEVYALTAEDDAKLKAAFPDGKVVLTSQNCPEVAAAIERASNEILSERKNLYERLARYD